MVKLRVRTSYGLPGWYPSSVTFWARERAQGGHGEGTLVLVGPGDPDPQDPGVFAKSWAASNYGHNGTYDAKVVVHWVKQGPPPPGTDDEILWQGFTVDNSIVDVVFDTVASRVTGDPYVFRYDPGQTALQHPEIHWYIHGMFAPETLSLLAHSIQIRDSGGGVVWQESGYSSATEGLIVWDGKNSAGQPCPAGLYSVMMSASRLGLQDGHSLRQCDVTVSTVPNEPLAVRYEKLAVGTVKFQFNYTLTDPTGNGADTVTATLYDPALAEVQHHALPTTPGTHEAYATFSGIDFTQDGTFTVLITYNEKTTQHSQWNKDHVADYGMPLAATFTVPAAVCIDGYNVGDEEAIVKTYVEGLDGPTWYAQKIPPEQYTWSLRETVNNHRPALVSVYGHGDGGHTGVQQIHQAEWVLCGYDATDPDDAAYHNQQNGGPAQPIASVSHEGYRWDLSRCLVAVFEGCYTSAAQMHGALGSAAVSQGAGAGVGFTEAIGGGIGWGDLYWGHLCIGPKHFGCSADGPMPVWAALGAAKWHIYQVHGEYHGYDSYLIAGDPGVMVVPAP